MAMTLTEFVLEEQDKLPKFEIWWVTMNKKDPDSYPMSLADGNEGLWFEQFQDFDVSWLSNL